VAVSSSFARGTLRKIWRDAQAAGKPLLTLLEAASDSAQLSAGSGKTIAATSGNGRSVTYQVNTGDATPTDLCELTARFLDLYDAAVTAGQTTDALRFGFMLGKIQPVTSTRSNFAVLLAR
jgi:hypothetical protein